MRYLLRIFISFTIILGAVHPLCAGGQEGNIFIEAVTEDGSRAIIDFGRLKVMAQDGKPEPASSVRLVRLSITNLSGAQYRVTQRVPRPLGNVKGSELEGGRVVSFAFGKRTDGTLFIPSPTALGRAEQVIFISNPAGEDDSFWIEYNLSLPGGVTSGRYRTDIIYTVTTLRR